MSSQPGKRVDGFDDWISDEPSNLGIFIRELQRFKERMKMHPVPVILLALLLSVGAVYRLTRKPPVYTSRIILRIGEGALSKYRGSPMPRGQLKNYIYSFSLTDKLLMSEIIEKHQLFQEEMDLKGADLALGTLREGLTLDVYYNFFHHNRNYEATPRSLRLAIEYTHEDPEFAYRLALLLAELVVDVESQKRLDEVRFATENARDTLRAAQDDYNLREKQLAITEQTLIEAKKVNDTVAATLADVEYQSLAERQKLAIRELDLLQAEVERIAFAQELEEQNMGLVFEYAGQVRPVAIPPRGPFIYGLLGLICFCVFVPVCAIGIGTVNSRVQNLDDVRRLGLPVIGHVPAFEGDDKGSLRKRGALMRRGPLALLGLTQSRRVRRAPPKIV